MRGRLTARKINQLDKVGRFSDGNGLYVQVANVSGNITRSWLFKFTSPLVHPSGRARPWVREMGLGAVDKIYNLEEAREAARRARQLVAMEIDPIEDRRAKKGAARAATMTAVTFKMAAEEYIKSQASAWRGGIDGRSADQWSQSLVDYVYPSIGALPVGMVEKAHILSVLKPIWETRTVTAERIRGRIEAILDWGRGHGLRAGDNPAAWKGNLDAVLPKPAKLKKVAHLAALAYDRVPEFMGRLRAAEGVEARLVELTVLTAARHGEAAAACWSEVDLDTRIWTVPATRMKSGRVHKVPLSDRACAILAGLARGKGTELVFADRRRPITNSAVLVVLRKVAGDETITLHGFRSTFRDWAGDCTAFPREVAEAALAHAVGDQTEAAYRRASALDKRRRLMATWADYCEGQPVQADVVPLRRA
jgi:integrase